MPEAEPLSEQGRCIQARSGSPQPPARRPRGPWLCVPCVSRISRSGVRGSIPHEPCWPRGALLGTRRPRGRSWPGSAEPGVQGRRTPASPGPDGLPDQGRAGSVPLRPCPPHRLTLSWGAPAPLGMSTELPGPPGGTGRGLSTRASRWVLVVDGPQSHATPRNSIRGPGGGACRSFPGHSGPVTSDPEAAAGRERLRSSAATWARGCAARPSPHQVTMLGAAGREEPQARTTELWPNRH